jgi:hypothetical protein
VVTGKFRLWTQLILTTLVNASTESNPIRLARVHNGRTNHHEGQEENCQESGEEASEEEKEVGDLRGDLRGAAVMSVPVVAAAAMAALVSVPTASASSITNRDGKDHKVTVIEGKAAKDQVLKPSAALEGICRTGCVIRLNDSETDEYELRGSDVVSIEGGYLSSDGPPASAGPMADEADQPFAPGAK